MEDHRLLPHAEALADGVQHDEMLEVAVAVTGLQHGLEHFATSTEKATLDVVQARPQETVQGEAEAKAQDMPVCSLERTTDPPSLDEVHVLPQEDAVEPRDVLGRVLQIGVGDDHVRSSGSSQAGPPSSSNTPVFLVPEAENLG